MKKNEFLTPAPTDYKWPQCPDADRFIHEQIDAFLENHSFAKRLADRMAEETNTEFPIWVDHLILPKEKISADRLLRLGFIQDKRGPAPKNSVVYWHPYADLPRLLLTTKARALSCAIMVESIADFQLAHKLSLPILGAPLSSYRESRIVEGSVELRIVERHGGLTLAPDNKDKTSAYLQCLELWTNRPRQFSHQKEGLKQTLALTKKLVHTLGEAKAAWVFLEGERRYWQRKNRAAQIQKARQDKLGLGWANHDHHTFRSGRPAFPMLIQILLTFGFKKRERYYAGADAGWGAQILEQPESRLIIFADVDLNSDEVSVDFTRVQLPELLKPGTVGLWCALHGESILEAGMHHLEAKFNFDGLRNGLKTIGVNFMNPFSDFPHLRQAFSEGEWWRVPTYRLEALLTANQISKEAYDRIKEKGAVGSHMENLQRRDGFKGFNQRGVSHIIREVNPEKQALKGPGAAS